MTKFLLEQIFSCKTSLQVIWFQPTHTITLCMCVFITVTQSCVRAPWWLLQHQWRTAFSYVICNSTQKKLNLNLRSHHQGDLAERQPIWSVNCSHFLLLWTCFRGLSTYIGDRQNRIMKVIDKSHIVKADILSLNRHKRVHIWSADNWEFLKLITHQFPNNNFP